VCNRYPDPTQAQLRAALAKLHGADGVGVANVVAGAGSDDILDIVLRVVSPTAIVICPQTFGMYTFLAKSSGIKVVEVKRNADFTVDVAAVVAAIREHKATVCFLPSPNNPTGTVLPNADAEVLLKEDCFLVVDEAYSDFCDTSAMSLVSAHQNLMVCRTFSKWAGLAGLRLGYGVGHSDIITPMMAIKQPYNVNTASEAAGLAALRYRDEIMVSVTALRAEKDRMFQRLRDEVRTRPPSPNILVSACV
jgi:histidinol-phosphate aminotransferase